MTFDKAHINENCVVHCPAGSSKFEIKANLVFITKQRVGNLSNIHSEVKSYANEVDLGFLASWLSGNWIAGIGLIIVLIIILLISIPLAPVIIRYLVGYVKQIGNIQIFKPKSNIMSGLPKLQFKSRLAKFKFKKHI